MWPSSGKSSLPRSGTRPIRMTRDRSLRKGRNDEPVPRPQGRAEPALAPGRRRAPRPSRPGRTARILGANDRVGVGFIGFGLIGKRHVLDFRDQPGHAYGGGRRGPPRPSRRGRCALGGSARGYGDFRRLLDDRDVDAVVVSTPDHWHALMTMMACAAGKDVYVEKPLTLFVREGRWMVDVARRHKRVVQVGTQQRSGPHYQKARELVQCGHIGKVVAVRMWFYRNVMPGFGSPPDGDPPPGLDYDLWLGPAPKRPYNPNRSIYHFRWFWDYSGGQMTNLGQHSLDIVHWFLGATAPAAVDQRGRPIRAPGQRRDARHPGRPVRIPGLDGHVVGAGVQPGRAAGEGLEFCGTRGSLDDLAQGLRRDARPEDRAGRRHPALRRRRIPPAARRARANATPRSSGRVSSRIAPATNSTSSAATLATSSSASARAASRSRTSRAGTASSPPATWRTCRSASGRKIRWDAVRETVIDDREAEAMLERPYRAPWDAERNALLGTA